MAFMPCAILKKQWGKKMKLQLAGTGASTRGVFLAVKLKYGEEQQVNARKLWQIIAKKELAKSNATRKPEEKLNENLLNREDRKVSTIESKAKKIQGFSNAELSNLLESLLGENFAKVLQAVS